MTFTDAFLLILDTAKGVTADDLAPLLHPTVEARTADLEARAAADPGYLNRVAAAQALISLGFDPIAKEVSR